MASGTSSYYESPQSRALGSITPTSYDYRDQGKTISKLINDTSYMAAYMRQMQKGIDSANENIVQQINQMLEEMATIIGGHGDTGFDFGDLKYILKMFGAFFNTTGAGDGSLPLPLSYAEAAWHFFTTYIVNGQRFKELINTIIDDVILELLAFFGDWPILENVVEQLAKFIANIRDVLEAISHGLHAIFDALGINWDDLPAWIDYWHNLFKPIFDLIHDIFGGWTNIASGDYNAIKAFFALFNGPYVQDIQNAIIWVRKFISMFSLTGGDLADLIGQLFQNLVDIVLDFSLRNVLSYGLMGLRDTPNLIANRTVDTGTVGWNLTPGATAFNGAWNSNIGHNGDGSIMMSGTGVSWFDSTKFAVVPKQKIVTSCWFSKPTIQAATISIGLAEYDVEENFIREVGFTNVSVPANSPDWTKITNDDAYRVSKDAFYVTLRVKVSQPTGGISYFDDFSLVKDGAIHSWVMPDFGKLVDGMTNVLKQLTGDAKLVAVEIEDFLEALLAIPHEIIADIKIGATGALKNFVDHIQDIPDMIWNAIWRDNTTSHSAAEIVTSLQNFPVLNLIGDLKDSLIKIFGKTIGQLFNTSGVIGSAINGAINTAVTIFGNLISDLFNFAGTIAGKLNGAINTAVTIFGNAISNLFNGSGILASMLTGALNTGITIFGKLVSAIFDGNGVIAGAISGAINTAITIFGNAISSLFNSSGILASMLTGAINTAITLFGNALSSLFDGNGLIASKISGALNTALTIAGNIISDLIDAAGIIAGKLHGAINTAVTIAGNAISSLFDGNGHIASAISGALNTAVTIAGNAISSLFNGSGHIASMIAGALNTGVTIAGNAISSLFNSSGSLASVLNGAMNTAVTIASNAISSLFNSSGHIASAIAGALNTAITISGNAISSLFNGSGHIASSIAGALNTGITISGNAISTLFDGNGVIASKISGALNTAITIAGNAISSLFDGNGLIASKISGALNTAVTIFGNSLSTMFSGSGVLASALTGAINTGVTIVGNSISNLFNSKGLISAFLNSIDASKVTTGIFNLNRFPNIFGLNPAKPLNRSNIADLGVTYNALVNSGAVTAKISRHSGSSISITANDGSHATGLFDTIENQNGIVANVSSSPDSMTVSIPGLYRATICFKVDGSGSNIWRIAPVLFYNGSVYEKGHDAMSYTTVANGDSIPRWIKSDFWLHMVNGDYVNPGYTASNATGTISTVLTGESTGGECFFELTLINPDVQVSPDADMITTISGTPSIN